MSIPNHDFLQFTLAQPEKASASEYIFPYGTAFIEGRGILRLEPSEQAQHSVVLSAGIHGNETAPIELLNALVAQLLTGELALSVRLLIIFGHPQAMVQSERFCDVNLNRLFCGAWQRYQGMEVARAQLLEQTVSDFFEQHQQGEKYHYDLHTAIRGSQYEKFAVHPFTNGAAYQKQQFAFYDAIGLEAVLLSHQATTTFSYYSYAHHGAQAATVELGQVRPFGDNDLSKLTQLEQALKELLVEANLAQGQAQQVRLYEVVDVLTKDADDYRLNIAADEKNFTAFSKGFELARSSKSCYQIQQNNDAIVFPNTKLPIGQRSGLVVRAKDWATLKTI
ncbi:Succinylglutamate desuccinylase [Marinomonas aquimarina]|uniref:Succinylglutamate desuccinylase n=1 Tax=Marinomonas aquimarina TaxID=295068 RepID=A0A1A8TIQ5_9GAMM|nr:succinylglutamate desuccinylase [Marinomonas aquimarina]SBS32369.1 Succinylglutamate desuccinylase [Marinomonas aquimarina]